MVTPVIERGYLEVEIYLDLYNWVEEQAPYLRGSKDQKKNRILSETIQDFLWFLEGQRSIEYPAMMNYLPDMRARAKKGDSMAKGAIEFYKWLKNPENRKVELAKNRVRVYEFAGTVTTAFV